ncbi:MAG: AAA family ATPase, partial [Candidatus Saccharimonadales bacterium]
MQIIGLSGTFSSGKDTLAKLLSEDYGFVHISTSDIVRELSLARYNSTDRVYLQKISNEYREKMGNDYFAAEAYKRYLNLGKQEKGLGLVISGMRSVGEAKKVKSLGGILVFVDAPVEIRYQRAKLRARDEEVRTFEDFKVSEAREWEANYGSNSKQNLRGIKEISDIKLSNNSDLRSFLNQALDKLNLKAVGL